jgi:hypothetical protein
MGKTPEQRMQAIRSEIGKGYRVSEGDGYCLTGKVGQILNDGSAEIYMHGERLQLEGQEGIRRLYDEVESNDPDRIECMAKKSQNQCVVLGFSSQDEGFFVSQDRTGDSYIAVGGAEEIYDSVQEVGGQEAVENPDRVWEELTR